MKVLSISLLMSTLVLPAVPAQAYKGLEADFSTCSKGHGKVSKVAIVRACSRLINNAKKKNELVGYFHALRAIASSNKAQNCQDAKVAMGLLKNQDLIANARKLAKTNCLK